LLLFAFCQFLFSFHSPSQAEQTTQSIWSAVLCVGRCVQRPWYLKDIIISEAIFAFSTSVEMNAKDTYRIVGEAPAAAAVTVTVFGRQL
jgi:hypothetical protein